MLTDRQVRNAKPGEKPYKLPDERGLHLLVTPAGHRSWRWRYQKDGRERLVVLGSYPEMSLREAREARDDRRQDLRNGKPAPPPTGPTFAEVAREWHRVNAPRWKPHHAADVLARLETHIFPKLGETPIAEVMAPALLDALRAVEKRSPDVAHRIRGRVESIFAFAIGAGHCATNPAAMIADAMVPMPQMRHRPAVTTLEDARRVLAQVEAIPAHPVVRLAMRFLALTAARPGEVGGMLWSERDGDLWRIPAARMKMGREHVVPLSRQAAEVLEAVRPLTGRLANVFPAPQGRRLGISENALGDLMRRAGLQGIQVPHGWRATFSTVMNERFPADRLVIDLMLAHAEARGQVEAAYNRAQHTDRRRELAQLWADLLLEGAAPAGELVKLARRR